jgi:rRNA maturation endonuclease Nob1
VKKCQWKEDKHEPRNFDTKCGKRFPLFKDGTPAANGFKFCPYCGGKLVDKTERGEG